MARHYITPQARPLAAACRAAAARRKRARERACVRYKATTLPLCAARRRAKA